LTNGRPAADLGVRLYAKEANGGLTLLTSAHTDGNGRAMLLEQGALATGLYRLEFEVGAHFKKMGSPLAEPLFLDHVIVDFGVSNPTIHHHVPLLVSPYGYSTYRGS
jgi:5-hydroxyisourate hydrolase